MTDLSDMDRKAKHNQLIKEGYCILPKVAPPRLIEEIREVTDELIDALTPAEQERYRLQGSLIEVLKHSSMAELISLPSAIDALRSLGFASLNSLAATSSANRRVRPRPSTGIRTGSAGTSRSVTPKRPSSFSLCTT